MNKKGFTLIELLIVVAIIAILAAIAVPNFLEAQVRSKVSRVKADHRSLATAIEAYYVDNNSYPAVAMNPAVQNHAQGVPLPSIDTFREDAFRLLHGGDAAEAAAETARRTFEEGAAGDALPTFDVDRAELESGIAMFALLTRAGLTNSNGEARRLIKGGGARLNDEAVKDETHSIGPDAINADGLIKLSAGRKRHALLRPV